MDRDDWIYLGAVLLMAAGAGCFHVGAGLLCAGAGAAFPFVLTMLRGGGAKKKDQP